MKISDTAKQAEAEIAILPHDFKSAQLMLQKQQIIQTACDEYAKPWRDVALDLEGLTKHHPTQCYCYPDYITCTCGLDTELAKLEALKEL